LQRTKREWVWGVGKVKVQKKKEGKAWNNRVEVDGGG
jgi:hypothetical protein